MAQPVPRTVLLVEDDDTIRTMMARRLTKRGFEVVAVASGEEALSAAAACRPSVVMMDLLLPGISGWDAAKAMRTDPATRDIPVVALTAHVSAEDRERAQEVGCDSFFSKPVDFEALVKRLDQLVPPVENP